MDPYWNFDTPRNMLKHAYDIAATSYDPSTQNGAILLSPNGSLIAVSANRFPGEVRPTDERLNDRDIKYDFVIHAETAVVAMAAKAGRSTLGATLICPWAACAPCAGVIIEAGIKRIIAHKQAIDRVHPNWRKSIDRGFIKLLESGIPVSQYDGEVGGVEVRFNYEVWKP